MANTRDTMGEQACLDALIAGTLTEFEDDEVYELREHAFYGYTALTSVNLPACTSVGDIAFYDCNRLTSVNLPACTSVGDTAFQNCQALTSVELPACTSVGDSVFRNCYRLTSVELPTCTSVGESAFNNCTDLTSIELPACTSVGQLAFYGCSALTSIALGYDGVVTKGGNAIPSQFNSGGTGTIYVPASQLAAYQASSSWSGYNLAAIPA